MGRQAVTSHEKSQMHIKLSTSGGITGTQRISQFITASKREQGQVAQQSAASTSANLLVNDTAGTSDVSPPIAAVAVAASNPVTSCSRNVTVGTIDTYVSNDSVGRSEILWAIKIVMSHHSFRSSIDIGQAFQLIYSQTARSRPNFPCQRLKQHTQLLMGSLLISRRILIRISRNVRVMLRDLMRLSTRYLSVAKWT